jgi:hypothetical protein
LQRDGAREPDGSQRTLNKILRASHDKAWRVRVAWLQILAGACLSFDSRFASLMAASQRCRSCPGPRAPSSGNDLFTAPDWPKQSQRTPDSARPGAQLDCPRGVGTNALGIGRTTGGGGRDCARAISPRAIAGARGHDDLFRGALYSKSGQLRSYVRLACHGVLRQTWKKYGGAVPG